MSRIEGYIQCVSIPRSGHHLLVDTLLKYYSGDIDFSINQGLKGTNPQNYCEPIRAGDFCYCAFYKCCQSVPCAKGTTNCQKNHDLDLDLEYNPEWKYIIQYRAPLQFLTSFYNWRFVSAKIRNYTAVDSKEEWLNFIGHKAMVRHTFKKFLKGRYSFFKLLRRCVFRLRQSFMTLTPTKLIYWKKFVYKWILDGKKTNRYVLNYDRLIGEPMTVMKEVVHFISPSEEIDGELLQKIIDKLDVRRRNDFKEFKYYDEEHFKKFEGMVSGEIEQLGLEKFYA